MLPLSSIASSGFHPIFTMDSMQKCEHKVKGKKIGFPPNKKGGKQILKFKWGGGTKGEGGARFLTQI